MSKYFLGKSREEMKSIFNKVNVYEGAAYKKAAIKLWGNEFLEKVTALTTLEEIYGKNIEYFIVGTNEEVTGRLPLGIAFKFKNIRTVEQVKRFASKYGPLGMEKLTKYELLLLTGTQFHDVGLAPIEPVEFWYDCARKIRCIVGLYNDLQTAYREKSEIALEYEEILGNNNRPMAYRYSWIYDDEGEEMALDIVFDSPRKNEITLEGIAKQNLEIGQEILIKAIEPFANSHLMFEVERIPIDNSLIGAKIIEHKYTNTLLTAIFYDLWYSIHAEVPTNSCRFCGNPFIQPERGRPRVFCSDKCRVAHNRTEKKTVDN